MFNKARYVVIIAIHIPFSVGIESKIVVCLKQALHDSRNYLKLDYRTHVSKSSRIADHCSTFGLSDAKNSAWREKCNHQHDEEYG